MSPFRILLHKEVLDVLRDRRTLFLTLGLPVVLYPLMILMMGVMVAAGTERLKATPLTIATVGAEAPALLAQRGPIARTDYRAMTLEAAKLELAEQTVAAIVTAPETARTDLGSGKQALVTVIYAKRFDRSREALDRLEPVFESLNVELLKQRLEEKALDASFMQPVKTEPIDIDLQGSLARLMAASMLPILLLTTLLTGAVQAAVDTTAGEKERGTFETLLVAPVKPTTVMLAKYATVTVVAVATALANLSSTALTFGVGVFVANKAGMPVPFSLSQIGLLALCMVPTASLVSGLALAVAATAQTMRQGQALMVPVILLGVAPGMLAQMPGIELNAYTALVPLLNVALLVKMVVLDTVRPLHVVLTLLSVMSFSVLAFRAAASVFNDETFRFGGTLSSSRMPSFWRRK